MLTIQNTHNTAVIYADTIDSGTEGMLREFCGLPLSAGSRIRVMPDVHAGKGCVIGLTMTLADRVAPRSDRRGHRLRNSHGSAGCKAAGLTEAGQADP